MTQPLPKWIQKRYAVLWKKFKNKEFTFEQAEKILKNNKAGINVFLSDLKKFGWMEVTLNQDDTRTRSYKLKSPEEGFKVMEK